MEVREIQVPNHILISEIKQIIEQGKSAKLRVKGYSMRLFLDSERDIVNLEPVEASQVKKSDVVLAEVSPQKYVLHRVIKRNGNHLTLMGDGNIKGTEKCLDTDVIALATAFYRKGRSVPDLVTGWKWRIYSRIWLTLKPFRRIILGIYRRLPFTI